MMVISVKDIVMPVQGVCSSSLFRTKRLIVTESTINTKVKIGSAHKEKAVKVTDGLIGALYGEHVSDR